MLIISRSINIQPYGHGTYQIVATDMYNPKSVKIAVNISDLLKLKESIDGILGEL